MDEVAGRVEDSPIYSLRDYLNLRKIIVLKMYVLNFLTDINTNLIEPKGL